MNISSINIELHVNIHVAEIEGKSFAAADVREIFISRAWSLRFLKRLERQLRNVEQWSAGDVGTMAHFDVAHKIKKTEREEIN